MPVPHILAAYFLFASAISVNKFLLGTLSFIFFVAIRTLVAGILMTGYTFIKTRHFPFENLKKDIWLLLLISVFTNFLPSLLKAYGLQNLTSSKSTLLGSLDPFVTAIFAYCMFGERLTKNKLAGMLVAFSGILVLLFTTSPAEEIAGTWGIISLPEIAALMSMVLSRYGWIMAQKLLLSNRYTPLQFNGINMLIGGCYALGTSIAMGTCDFCTMPPTASFWVAFSYTVFIGQIAGYTVYAHLLKRYSVTLISLCGLAVPLYVHLLGPFIVGEKISLVFFIALGLVFAGTYIFTRQPQYVLKPKA